LFRESLTNCNHCVVDARDSSKESFFPVPRGRLACQAPVELGHGAIGCFVAASVADGCIAAWCVLPYNQLSTNTVPLKKCATGGLHTSYFKPRAGVGIRTADGLDSSDWIQAGCIASSRLNTCLFTYLKSLAGAGNLQPGAPKLKQAVANKAENRTAQVAIRILMNPGYKYCTVDQTWWVAWIKQTN
jgi:hypothetical protein